ncbi:MAG: hypothetical protein MJ236_02495 [Clostridia bacterium]|nr:hypothetical protein [Clostridia bacterium]
MSKGTRICKICGKEYEYCKTKAQGMFIWRDVACCEEHAKEYFRKVAISRGELEEKVVEEPVKNFKKSGNKYESKSKDLEPKVENNNEEVADII